MTTEVLRVPAGLLQRMYDLIAAARHPNVEYASIRAVEQQLAEVGRYTEAQIEKLVQIEAAELEVARGEARITDVLDPQKHDRKAK